MIGRLAELDRRQRNFAAAGIVSILVAALTVYVLLPQAKEFRSHSVSRNALLGVTADGSTLPAEIESRMAMLDQLTRELHGDSAHLPAREMEAFVIGRLQTISWDHEIELVSVTPAEGERIENFVEVLFRVELEGGYDSVYRWLGTLREQLGYVVIKEFTLRRVDQVAVNPTLRATLTLASYRQESA